MVTGKLYCVNLLADCWLTCDTIYSPNSTVKSGAHILHNLITCKCSIVLLPCLHQEAQIFNQMKIGFSWLFSRLVYLWFKCVVKILCWSGKLLLKHISFIWKLFCKKNSQFASVVNFTSKILISCLLIKLHKPQRIKNWRFSCVSSLQSQWPSTSVLKKLLQIEQ